jgi:hypothetical protein
VATQGEIRSRAVSAVRSMRRQFRAADTAGEKVERELDRLVKRKTLISPNSLQTLSRLQVEYAAAADRTALAMRDLYLVIIGTIQL